MKWLTGFVAAAFLFSSMGPNTVNGQFCNAHEGLTVSSVAQTNDTITGYPLKYISDWYYGYSCDRILVNDGSAHKAYFEIQGTKGQNIYAFGVAQSDSFFVSAAGDGLSDAPGYLKYDKFGKLSVKIPTSTGDFVQDSASGAAKFTNGDQISVRVNTIGQSVQFYHNGDLQGTVSYANSAFKYFHFFVQYLRIDGESSVQMTSEVTKLITVNVQTFGR